MRRISQALVMMALLLTIIASPGWSQVASDVPPGNWAYKAVEDLASKGLIKGYPPNGNFFGKRTVTRYEMATIIQRVLIRVDELLANKADKSEINNTPKSVLTPAEVGEIRKLADHYRVELTVIQTDMTKAQSDIATLQTEVEGLKSAVAANQQATEKNTGNIANLSHGVKSVTETEKEQAARITKLADTKVSAGDGKIQINGDEQIWFQGSTQNDNASPSGGFQANGFRLRRMELKLTGQINNRSYWDVLFDLSKSLSGSITRDKNGNPTGVSLDATKNVLQDMFVGWKLTPNLAFEVGQQHLPLGLEGLTPSTHLLTVERSIMNLLPTNDGRYSDIRDIGALMRYTNPQIEGELAVFNDGGNLQNQTDNNNSKEIIWHGVYNGLRYVSFGASQVISGGVQVPNAPQTTLRDRLGFQLSAKYGRNQLEAEYEQGRDGGFFNSVFSPDIKSQGGYVTYAYKLAPSWQLVGRGEYWNPNREAHGVDYVSEYDMTLGLNYFIAGHNSEIQANWVRKNINDPNGLQTSVLGADRNLFLINFQQAF